jgi:ABC-type transporter Mla MlaB component
VAAAAASGLVVAAAAGVGLAVVLFVRDHARRSPVRSRGTVAGIRSSHRRLPPEGAVLTACGAEAAVLTLQGDLFFGTADRLLTEMEPDLGVCRLVLLDLSRVADVDLTAARILAQAEARLAARGGTLLLAETRAPEQLAAAMEDVAPRPRRSPARFFASRDEALEWCEERILEAHLQARPAHGPRPLAEMDLLAGLDPELLAAVERHVEVVSAADGERVFRAGDPGDALYLVRVGRLRLAVPAQAGRDLMLGVFGRGDVVGELAFVDGRRRSADAVAYAPTELYRLTRRAFEAAASEAPALRAEFAARLAKVLTYRLRVTTAQLKAAEE